MADATAVIVAAAAVVGVICLGASCRRRLRVRRVRGTVRSRMFRRATGGAVLLARPLAAAPRAAAAASHRFPIVWLIVALPAVSAVAMAFFVMGALRRAAVVAMGVVVAVIVDNVASIDAIAAHARAVSASPVVRELVVSAVGAP